MGGLPDGVVLVVDEASMVGTRQLATLSDHVTEASGKLVLIGDPHQLPEIEAGGISIPWSTDSRQRSCTRTFVKNDPGSGQPSLRLRNGSVADAMSSYRKHRRLVIGRSRDETLVRAVHDWYQHVNTTGNLTGSLLLARDNETVRQLNLFCPWVATSPTPGTSQGQPSTLTDVNTSGEIV